MERKVLMTIKIFPTGIDVDLDALMEAVRAKFADERVVLRGKEYIGFGIEALVIDPSAPERDGVSQDYEDRIKSIEGVGEISVEGVRRFVDLGKPT